MRHCESAAEWGIAEAEGLDRVDGDFIGRWGVQNKERYEHVLGEFCSEWKVDATFDQAIWAETAGLGCCAVKAEERAGMLDHGFRGTRAG